MTEVITYETLFELLQKEKIRKEIQTLDKDFFNKFLKYLEEKTLILQSQKSKDSLFSSETRKTEKQLENVRKIIKDLYERRERKILENALFSARNDSKNKITGSLLPEERDLYEKIKENIKDSREGILFNLLQGKHPELKAKTLKTDITQGNNVLVRFLAAVPKFIGNNNNSYGPFEKEDIAALPFEISEILIKKKRAEKIEVK
ncbi:MAG: hypothetical protein KKG75_00735 [Nanoarchaeota archaeon]|nr:hypothetical protein [Nanoarchaeota archaeon]